MYTCMELITRKIMASIKSFDAAKEQTKIFGDDTAH